MSLTIYEVLCNARYNLENAVFPLQVEMAKEQLANALDAIDNGKTLNDVWEEAQPNAAVPYKPTFTPQNEPLTQAELNSMDYDKVWIDYEDGTGEWALVYNVYIYSIGALEGAGLDFVDYMRGEKLEPYGYKVYRRPPEGEAK